MALYYGTTTELPGLSREEIGFAPKKNDSGLIGFFRILLDIAAIGASLIPGINLVVETGVALTAGAINEAIDVSQGTASVSGTILNLGAPLIAAAGVARTSSNIVKTAEESFGTITQAADNLINLGVAESRAEALARLTGRSVDESQRILKTTEALDRVELTPFQAANSGQRTIENTIIEAAGNDISRKEARDMIQVIKKLNKELPKGKAQQAIKNELQVQKRILRTIGLNNKEINEILRNISNVSLTSEQRYSYILGYLRNADVLTTDRARFKSFVKALNKGEILLNEAYQIPLARQFARLANKNFPIEELTSNARKESETLIKRIFKVLKNPGSRQFNDFIVQPTQAVFDANDAGRAPIEFLYRQFKKQIRTWFKAGKKAIAKAETLEDAFTRTGGIVVDSGWILGYKVIKDNPVPGAPNIIMINFIPEETKSKQPVLVSATSLQIEKFILSPGEYYLNHFAYSKGGKSLGLKGLFNKGGFPNIRGIGNISTNVLGFLPINAIRNILSITSNIVENTYSMSKGEWTNQWKGKFLSSLKRASINRTFRLLGREVVGGAAGRALGRNIGLVIGKETQRLGTNVFAPIVRNIASGKPALTGITKSSLAQGFATGVKSNLRRLARNSRGSNSVVLQTLSARRKIQQVNRLPNAIVPGRPYKGIRLISKPPSK